jgi:exonuclease VII large subunit
MSADNYIVVDHDGDVFQIYEGSMSAKLELGNYEPILVDTVATVREVNEIIDGYGLIEHGVDWTVTASSAIEYASTPAAAVEKVLEKLDEMNTKVVNLANRLDKHMKERDAHHVAMLSKK